MEVMDRGGAGRPVPLTEALPDEMYAKYIAPPPPLRAKDMPAHEASRMSIVQSLSMTGVQPPPGTFVSTTSLEKRASVHDLSLVEKEGEGKEGEGEGDALGTSMSAAEQSKLHNIFAQLSPTIVRQVVDQVCAEMLHGLEVLRFRQFLYMYPA